MTKQGEEHLTTEQLSALLDKQLSAQEEAIVDTHLRACQQCRQALADLRQTVALLHALPQVEVPRSFALPARIAVVQEQPTSRNPLVTPISQRNRARQHPLQRTFRVISSLAAVIGLIFILSSFVTTLPQRGANSTASSGANSTLAPKATSHSTSTPRQRPSVVTGTQPGAGSPSVRPQTPTPTPSQAVKAPTSSTGPPGQPAPAIFDLSTPSSHLLIGSALLVFAILGFALTRRR